MKKRFRVKTGTRLYEIPNHPEIRLFEPKMSYFLEMSMAITRLLHKYVPAEAIHVYSVDESFIDLSGTEKLWGEPARTVENIQAEILETLNLPLYGRHGTKHANVQTCTGSRSEENGICKVGHMRTCKQNYGRFPHFRKCGELVVRQKNH